MWNVLAADPCDPYRPSSQLDGESSDQKQRADTFSDYFSTIGELTGSHAANFQRDPNGGQYGTTWWRHLPVVYCEHQCREKVN